MKKLFVFFMITMLAGCAHAPADKPGNEPAGNQLTALQASLEEKQARITQLEELVSQQQAQLQEKDAQIQSLKDRLAQFGVF